MGWGGKQAAIVAALRDDPSATSAEIGVRVGAAASYVRVVARRSGFTRRLSYGLWAGMDENSQWLAAEAKRLGISPAELVEAIITDARLDAEEGGR